MGIEVSLTKSTHSHLFCDIPEAIELTNGGYENYKGHVTVSGDEARKSLTNFLFFVTRSVPRGS